MGEHPDISIIIPVWNGRDYISGLFSLLRAQRGAARFEVIVVDDGSTDGSAEAVETEAAAAPFSVNLIRGENAGASAARNRGLAGAKGDYVCFVDADDAVSPDYTESLLRQIDEGAFDVLIFDMERVTKKRRADEIFRAGKSLPAAGGEKGATASSSDEQLNAFLQNPTKYSMINILTRRAFLEEKRIRFSEGHAYFEDYDFLLQVFAQAETVRAWKKTLYYYILRDGSMMGRFSEQRIRDLALMRERGQWLEEKKPDFAKAFRKWGVQRLYWSVLWQAALTFSKADFRRFTDDTDAPGQLRALKDFPDARVRLSSKLFFFSPGLYRFAMRRAGRGKTLVTETRYEDYLL